MCDLPTKRAFYFFATLPYEKGHKKTGNLIGRRVLPSPKSGDIGTPDSSKRTDYKKKQQRSQMRGIVGIGETFR